MPLGAHAQIFLIIDANGDGGGNMLRDPLGITVDGSGNVYVTGFSSRNAFKITPSGTITEIIDANGDGGGNMLSGAGGVAVDGVGSVNIAGSDNAFKIPSDILFRNDFERP